MENLEKAIQKFYEEYKADVAHTREDIHELALRIPSVKAKWIEHKVTHLRLTHELETKLNDLVTYGVDAVRKKNEERGTPVTKTGAEHMIKTSEKYKKIESRVKNLKILNILLGDLQRSMDRISFDIQNTLNALKEYEG